MSHLMRFSLSAGQSSGRTSGGGATGATEQTMDFSYPALVNDPDVIASVLESVESDLSPITLDHSDQDRHVDLARTQEFHVRLANTEERRESASILIKRMYTWRGYGDGGKLPENPNRITLLASGTGNAAIGTLSVGLDLEGGLLADEMYHEELDRLREEGCVLCEYNRLAIDPKIKSKRIISSLFHIAYLYPHRLFGATDGVLEVNPRHVKFYMRMLGFTLLGPEKICSRVNAPSVLLRTNFAYMAHQVEQLGGLMDKVPHEKSLYPYFFTKADETGIVGRLRNMSS